MTSIANTTERRVEATTILKPPVGGIFLISHLAVLGLATILDAYGEDTVRIGHEQGATFDPYLACGRTPRDVTRLLRETVTLLDELVLKKERDKGTPAIRARDTFKKEKVATSQRELLARNAARVRNDLIRQDLLDNWSTAPHRLALCICAGLGAPRTWLGVNSSLSFDAGASMFDGVPYKSTTDIVRTVFRAPGNAIATNMVDSNLWDGSMDGTNKTPWAPLRIDCDPATQFLAGLGLACLPVAHRLRSRSLTPTIVIDDRWRRGRAAVFPILSHRVTLARLRAILASADLIRAARLRMPGASQAPDSRTAVRRLRAWGIKEVAIFPIRDTSDQSTVSFFFDVADRYDLREP